MRETFTQTNWFGGQIAEQRHGNATDELYLSSSATIENLVVRPTGSLTRRPGTKFVARTDGNTSLGNENKTVRLVPFVFGHESANNYVLEFGQGYIKLYKDGAVLGGTNSSNASQTHLKITGTPYDTNEKLENLQFVQSADILFLVTPKVAPYKLSRTVTEGGETNTYRSGDGFTWTLEYFPYKNGPYLGQQEDNNFGNTDTTVSVTVPAGAEVDSVSFTDNTCDTNHTTGLGSPTSTSNVTMDSTSKVRKGMAVEGSGIASGAYVTNVVSSTVITLSSATTATASNVTLTFKRGEEFINSNFGGNNPKKAKNGMYSGATGNLANLSFFQVKNHGLQDGMKIQLANGTSAGTAPKNGTWYVKDATANTFRISADQNEADNFTADGNGATTHEVFAHYYPKGTALTLDSSADLFKSTDDDRHFRISLLRQNQIFWVWGKLTYVNAKQATLTLELDCPAVHADDLLNIKFWKFGEYFQDQYPHHVAIFQQRMVFARNTRSPQTVWFSNTGDFENFAPSEQLGSATGQSTATGASIIGDQILATNGMTFTFDSGTIDEIQWLVAQQKLVAGSTGGIYAVYGSEQDLTITPFNFTIKRESTQPAQTNSNAIPYDNNILFIQGTGKKIRLITYGDISSSATSADMTFRATDILLNQAVQVVETDIPNFLSWFRLKDGTLVGLTYIPQQETIAWHQHKIGGDYSYTNTRGGDPTGNLASDKSHAVVLDMCTIPSSTRDQLWMLVRRTIPVVDGGNSHRIIESVEVMEDWMTTETISESKYLDGHVTHTGTNVASGELDHLEGETVGILSDGSVLDNQVVNNSGQLTSSITSATTIIAGKRFTSKLITLPISVGPGGRIRIGNKKRIHRVFVKIHKTPNFKFAVFATDTSNVFDESTLTELVTRTIANQYGEAPFLASETKELVPRSQGFTDGQFIIQQADPLPMNLLAYEVDFETNDN